MEQIPFTETRNLRPRVIENVVIYRARNPATASLEHPLGAASAPVIAGRSNSPPRRAAPRRDRMPARRIRRPSRCCPAYCRTARDAEAVAASSRPRRIVALD